jgi:acyl carrier protein phosphodiesterase
MSRSLDAQISSVRHVIALAHNSAQPEVLENANDGLASLEWLFRNVDVVREIHRLMTEHPAIIALLRAFPGARIEING